MRMMAGLALCLISGVAQAGQVGVYLRDTWTADADVAGTDGWVSGYRDDPWVGSQSTNSLLPQTDDNVGNQTGRLYGSGWAADNWLIRGDSFEQGGIKVDLGTYDDDTAGIVLAHNGSDTFYLLFYSADSAPPPVGSVNRPSLVLLRVEAGVATEVGRAQVAELTDTLTVLRLNRFGDRLSAFYGPNFVFGYTDPNPLPGGQAGVYSYDAGIGSFGDTPFFDSVYAYEFDTDDDGIPDDDDNCPTVANPDQADRDMDGTGNACEGGSGGDTDVNDTDVNDTDVNGTDTDVPSDTDGGTTDGPADTDSAGSDTDAGGDGGIKAACEGCSNGGATGLGAAAAGLLAVAARRRRSR